MSEKIPEFTIITSSLNCRKNIERCINSVISQKNVKLEHIIVDGASTDGTCDIIQKMAKLDGRIKFISEADKGIYEAWNKGIKLASGLWLLFLGADDYLLNENVLSQVKEKITLNHNSFAFISCECIKGFDGEISSSQYKKSERFITNPYDGPTLSMPSQPSLFHSKKIFDRGAHFDESYATAADKKLFLTFFGVASIQYIDIAVTYFTMGGVTNRDGNKIKRWMEKERMRKELKLPIVAYPYFRSLFSSIFRDLLYCLKRPLRRNSRKE